MLYSDGESKRDPLRIRRSLAALFAWILFGFAWWLVLLQGIKAWEHELLLLPLLIVVTVFMTWIWKEHNRAIYRRRGPRKGLPLGNYSWVSDSLGRAISIDKQVLSAQEVTICLSQNIKCYKVVS